MTIVGSALKNYGVFAFGTWNDRFGEEYKKTKGQGSIWERTKSAYKTSVEADKKVLNGLGNSTGRTAFVKDIGQSLKRGGNYLRGVGKDGAKIGIGKGLKAFGKGAMKRMPLIGNVMVVATEAPKIFTSFNDYGAGEGLKQTARVGLELGGFAAGAAAGAAIGSAVPVIGTIIGGIVGGLLASGVGKAIFGKSKVDKQNELIETYAAQGVQLSKEDAKQLVKEGITPEVLAGQQVLDGGGASQTSFSGNPNNAFAQQGKVNPYAGSGFNPTFSGSGGIQFGDEWMTNSFVSLPAA